MRAVLILAAIAALGFGGWWYVRQNPEVIPAPLRTLSSLRAPSLPRPLTEGPAAEQMEIFSQRAQTVTQETQKVLGESIKLNETESNKSLPEKAVDHSLYLYCQGYVKAYEEAVPKE